MKLCLVSRHWHEYSTGGTEIYIKNFLRTSKSMYEKIFVIIPSGANKISIEEHGNVIIHKVPFIPIVASSTKPTQAKSLKLYSYIDKLVSEEKINLIETNSITPVPSLFFAVFMAGMKNKVPVVERLHATPNNPTWLSILKDVGFAKVICVSKYLSEYMYRNGVRSKKLASVYPGINTEKFKPIVENMREELGYSDNDFVIMHASRLATVGKAKVKTIEAKGVVTLLKAFSIVAENNPNAKLLIAAALPLQENMRKHDLAVKKIMNYCDIYHIADKVKVIPVKYEDMPLAYNTCDIFTMVSLEETFGLVYAEAMSCEKPVIASSVCAMPELITNNETGFLVAPDDSVELSKRITWLIDDQEKREDFGKAGRKRVLEKFEENQIANQMKELYSEIVTKNIKIK